jgi:thiamine pyrophosphokinase
MAENCLIILSYIEDLDRSQALSMAEEADYIICADGGQTVARKLGIRPDCVIGDFDSTFDTEEFDCLYITYPAEKDLTDTEAALGHASEIGAKKVRILGGIGGRLDHTMGNVSLLLKYSDSGMDVEFTDSMNSMRLLSNCSYSFIPDPRFRYFALCSLDDTAEGVTVTGAKYPLDDFTLRRDTTLGISNEFAAGSSEVTVTVRNGRILLIRSSDAGRK